MALQSRYLCCMRASRYTLPLVLMVSSIVLLVVLQVFWLRSSYEKAYFDLRRETNELFRSTVAALRDSLLLKNFQQVPDSLPTNSIMLRHHRIDSAGGKTSARLRWRESATQVQVFISSDEKSDSLKALLRPLTKRIQDGQVGGGNFILRISPDSLSTDTLRLQYEKALLHAGISARVDVTHRLLVGKSGEVLLPPPFEGEGDAREKKVDVLSDIIFSEWVRFDPIHRYGASLSGIRPLLIKEITPQILFSAFVTLLTTAAFFLMYRSIRAQQKLMELKNDFISNITHELKTPVTTVSVALEALKNFRGLENPKLTEEYLDIAQSELNRLTILTDKILKTAIFENKGVSFQPEPVDLEKLITQILGSMKLLFEKQKAKVTFQKQGENFVVFGGSVHLTNVIYNLLDNALKYSPNEPTISVSLKNEDSKIEIVVKDEGIGIPAEFRKKVFEKFFRVPTGDVHNIKGYGLGLSYVDSVIRSHHGTIEVAGGDGPGSEFRIVLPNRGGS